MDCFHWLDHTASLRRAMQVCYQDIKLFLNTCPISVCNSMNDLMHDPYFQVLLLRWARAQARLKSRPAGVLWVIMGSIGIQMRCCSSGRTFALRTIPVGSCPPWRKRFSNSRALDPIDKSNMPLLRQHVWTSEVGPPRHHIESQGEWSNVSSASQEQVRATRESSYINPLYPSVR